MSDSRTTELMTEWPGALISPSLYAESWVARVNDVIDAAKLALFETVVALLDATDRWTVPTNVWRPGGTSSFTPLHHAAWHGVGREWVDALVERGALRNLPDADGRTPLDVARERGHEHQVEVLVPVAGAPFQQVEHLERLTPPLHGLLKARMQDDRLELDLRLPPAQALVEMPLGSRVWFAIPGMYGGFSIYPRESHLFIESSSRMDDSYQSHIVFSSGCVRVDAR